MEGERVPQEKQIPVPDLRSPEAIGKWVDEYTGNYWMKSFDDLRNPDGSFLSDDEKISLTRDQLKDLMMTTASEPIIGRSPAVRQAIYQRRQKMFVKAIEDLHKKGGRKNIE